MSSQTLNIKREEASEKETNSLMSYQLVEKHSLPGKG